MKTCVLPALRLFIVLTVLTGVLYPLAVTAVARLAFSHQASGSQVMRQGQLVGSDLLAQKFTSARYFWPRPSACDYGTVPSGASNLGPTSADLQQAVADRATALRTAHHLATDAPLPADLLYASGSGLDPHLSPAAARLQVARVAAARALPPARVAALVEHQIEGPQFGLLGDARVNVLRLNLALDTLSP